MNQNAFALLYNDFMASVNDADMMIDFYHKNAVFLNNIQSINNKDDLGSYIQITNKYAWGLWQKNRFSKTVEFINDRLPFINSEITRLNAPELKDGWYYYILFYKAASYYNMRNFKAAHPLFIELTEHDPEDELFRNWLKHTEQGFNMRILRILGIIAVVMIFSGLIFQNYLPKVWYRSLMSDVGFVIGFGAFACELYLKYKLKKSNKK